MDQLAPQSPAHPVAAAFQAAQAQAEQLARKESAWLNVAGCMHYLGEIVQRLPAPPWTSADLAHLFRLTSRASPTSQIDGLLVLATMADAIDAAQLPDHQHPDLAQADQRARLLQALLLLLVTDHRRSEPKLFMMPEGGVVKRFPGQTIDIPVRPEEVPLIAARQQTQEQTAGVLAVDLAALLTVDAHDAWMPLEWRTEPPPAPPAE